MKILLQCSLFFAALTSSFLCHAKLGLYLTGDVTNIKRYAGVVELNFTGEIFHHSGIKIDVKDVKVIFPFDNLVCDSYTRKKATESEFEECFIPKSKLLVIHILSPTLEFGINLEYIRPNDSLVVVYHAQ